MNPKTPCTHWVLGLLLTALSSLTWSQNANDEQALEAELIGLKQSLKQVAAVISAKKVQLTPEEARDLAKRAVKFKQERGRNPSITSPDAWEKKMAEGVAFLVRMKQEAPNG